MNLNSIRTGRLTLSPVSWRDMNDIARLKADGAAFGMMLGGVRNRQQAEADMVSDITTWAKHGSGMFAIRENGKLIGITGIHERPDGRGMALRFAIHPSASGRGLAREAAAAALRHAHAAGIGRVIAVARDTNIASRKVLGGIGMHVCDSFMRDGHEMLVFESMADRRSQDSTDRGK
ncbi:GNAT family N-acetyltransferase [Acetobacter estunensis]|uniref:GNAT family N-acetyltransferase n=1 Tax=Acetobacter estunensis TaxID=104097 RepID=UPI001C2D43BF|nr:GNAT family N-acetyltransferase [Acetobacter estunensis]MBV1837104.1 GNAT family N-acetyltransferase [Acetobacter estunensis]